MMSKDFCPKCGELMHSPLYNRSTDLMVLTCRCGYQTTRQPLDAKGPQSEDVRRLLDSLTKRAAP